jgi:hypothetical protein
MGSLHAWDRTNVRIRTELPETESQWLEMTGLVRSSAQTMQPQTKRNADNPQQTSVVANHGKHRCASRHRNGTSHSPFHQESLREPSWICDYE